jgi:hypothetical protein
VDGGLVVKFTNWLSTDRSLANLRLFFEAFYELGRYSGRRHEDIR